MDPAELSSSRQGRRPEGRPCRRRLRILQLRVPDRNRPAEHARRPRQARYLRAAGQRRQVWSIRILDEGPPEPGLDHRKFDLSFTRTEFLNACSTQARLRAGQLTAAKLERLMDRYVGKEWLPSRLKHLDSPENERADVIRGLKTYVAASPENSNIQRSLRRLEPAARRVLEPEVIKQLETPSSHKPG